MNELEFLREIFKDQRLHIGIGTIEGLGLSKDGSVLRVMVMLLPENRQIVCEYGFSDVYDVTFPEIKDLVLVAHVDGDVDEAFVIKCLNTSEEKIPALAQLGHSVRYSRPGKKLYLGSDTKVGVGRVGNDQTSPMVLGDVMANALTQLLSGIEACVTNIKTVQAALTIPPMADPLPNFAATFVTNASTNIKSQIAFTER